MANENSNNHDDDNDNNSDVEAISLANTWSGRRVIICGVGGAIGITNANQQKSPKTTPHNKDKKTPASAENIVKTKHGKGTMLVIERPPPPQPPQQPSSETTTPATTIPPGAVSFRVAGTQQYLTMMIYGDQLRQDTSNALASLPSLLPDHIPDMVDYAVDRPTLYENETACVFKQKLRLLLSSCECLELCLTPLEVTTFSAGLGQDTTENSQPISPTPLKASLNYNNATIFLSS